MSTVLKINVITKKKGSLYGWTTSESIFIIGAI